AGGDLHCPGGTELLDGHTDGRSGSDAQVLHLAAGRDQAGQHGMAKHQSAGPAVPAEDDLAPLGRLAQGGGKGQGRGRCQSLADDAANPRDADDQTLRNHGASLCNPGTFLGPWSVVLWVSGIGRHIAEKNAVLTWGLPSPVSMM